MNHDLHSHSTASDGTLTPAELVRHAAAAGVDVLALTDHDLTDGLAEAHAAAREAGIGFVPGVEISAIWQGRQTVHIVGLGIDPQAAELSTGLARMREFRVWRAAEIARRLQRDARIEGALEGAQRLAGGGLIARTHFARFLVEQGRARDLRAVFRRFLVRGKPGYVPGEWAAMEEVIGWVHAAGGVSVLAHPLRYRLTAMKMAELVTDFKACGGQALEVISGTQNADDTGAVARLAEKLGLLASRGSDYHGPGQGGPEPGAVAPLPQHCRPVWQALAVAA